MKYTKHNNNNNNLYKFFCVNYLSHININHYKNIILQSTKQLKQNEKVHTKKNKKKSTQNQIKIKQKQKKIG